MSGMDWPHLWHSILAGVAQHPTAAYTVVLLVALAESLALVGLLVPGTVIMLGIGALVGSGTLSLPQTLLAAMAGAIAGDGLSYWLGHHYHQGLKTFWPFRRYPGMLERGEAFFHRHGGKSVLLGRFVGPMRPVIPLIAGMLNMPPARFVLVNVLSGAGWALAYLLPGVLLGGSLTLIGAVSARLCLLLVLLLVLLWLTFGLCRRIYHALGRLGPRGERLLPLLTLALLLATWLFLGVLEDVVTLDPLVQADLAIHQFLQSLRTPWGDALLVAVTELGDAVVNVTIVVAVLLVLLLQRRLRAAGYWLLAAGGGTALVQLLKWTLRRPRPIDIYQGISSWSFPSGHSTMSVVIYGFLAVLVVRGCRTSRRWLPFGAAIGLSLLIAFSRLYLGAHWFSDVVGGLALGWAWVTLLGLAYLHRAPEATGRALLLPVALVILLVGGWHIHQRHGADQLRYQEQLQVRQLGGEEWRQGGWQRLPGWRIDLVGEVEQPLTLQWAGDPEALAVRLIDRGWQRFAGLDGKRWLNLLVPHATIRELPLLPQLESGHQERLLLALTRGDERLVLRLWPTGYRLADSGRPLWVGTVQTERARTLAGFLTLPRGAGDYTAALRQVAPILAPTAAETHVQRTTPHHGWDGRVLLAGP